LPIDVSQLCQSKPTPPHASPPASSSASAIFAQIARKIPSATQRWSVRWTDESSPKLLGSAFHWQPVRIR
jgi:hypothetical protein